MKDDVFDTIKNPVLKLDFLVTVYLLYVLIKLFS